jgi:hypothetical protein
MLDSFFYGRLQKSVFLLVLGGLCLPFFSAEAQREKSFEASQECYDFLQRYLGELPGLESVYQGVKNMPYKQFQSRLSPGFKMAEFEGVALSSPDFRIRAYSFGARTNFVPPRTSPFPATFLSDSWEKPIKQYVLVEELLQTPAGEQFLSCGMWSLETADFEGFTNQKYWYDGVLQGYLEVGDGAKILYTENLIYDTNGSPFGRWKKLFVFPASTVQEYFDRYSVAESLPIQPVERIADALMALQEVDSRAVTVLDGAGAVLDSHLGDRVYRPEGYGDFYLDSYYAAIASRFPLFASHLSLRGVFSYDLYARLAAEPQTKAHAFFAHIWNLFVDDRTLTLYDRQREERFDEGILVYDTYLEKLADISEERNLLQEEIVYLLSEKWTVLQGSVVDDFSPGAVEPAASEGFVEKQSVPLIPPFFWVLLLSGGIVGVGAFFFFQYLKYRR